MLNDPDVPMPEGVEKMSKQELWNWFSRCSRAKSEQAALDRRMFYMMTSLHGAYVRYQDDPWSIIVLQAKRIKGVETQMAQMQKGYKKKIDKLTKELKNG